MTAELERTLEALLFLSSDPVDAEALADATGAELHEVVTGLERLREHYDYERRGLVLRQLAGGNQDQGQRLAGLGPAPGRRPAQALTHPTASTTRNQRRPTNV